MCGMCFQRQISHLGGNKLIRCLLALRWKTVSPTCFGKLQEQQSIKRQSKAQVVVCVGSYCSAIWEEIPRVVCARLGTTWEFWQVASIHTNTQTHFPLLTWALFPLRFDELQLSAVIQTNLPCILNIPLPPETLQSILTIIKYIM